MTDPLPAARDAYRRREWGLARRLFARAAAESELSVDDLQAMADAAWWEGDLGESLRLTGVAYRRHLDAGRPRAAAMQALVMGYNYALRGEDAAASAWMSRAHRLLSGEADCPEQAYFTYVTGVEAGLGGAELDSVVTAARDVQEAGGRHGDAALVALGLAGRGRALIKLGEVAEGMRLLDDALATALDGDVDAEWVGNIYCHVMAACHEVMDIRRAREWTEATAAWVATFPSAAVFAGICRVHRSQLLQTTGEWAEAEREAAKVCAELPGIAVATTAEAHYQLGELFRLRGDFDAAVRAYDAARDLGRDPQPGLALLRLAQGSTSAAATSIRAALIADGRGGLARARLWAAQVEISLAADDVETARKADAELRDMAGRFGSSGLHALAAHARGLLVLAEAGPEEALPILREACRQWRELDAAYECARAREALADAYVAVGDADASSAERRAALETFSRLGAVTGVPRTAATPDVKKAGARADLPGGLTGREAEVLSLVATGKSNREVAKALVLSEKTVARHLSNIFAKIGVSSRTEAAAYAFHHELLAR